jgi:hypothetical protein
MLTTIILALTSVAVILTLAIISVYRDSVNWRHVDQLLFPPDSISDFDRPSWHHWQ